MCTSIKDMAVFLAPCEDLGVVTLRVNVGGVATWDASLYVSERVAGKAGREGRWEAFFGTCCWPGMLDSLVVLAEGELKIVYSCVYRLTA